MAIGTHRLRCWRSGAKFLALTGVSVLAALAWSNSSSPDASAFSSFTDGCVIRAARSRGAAEVRRHAQPEPELPGEEPRFSLEKLRAETEDPFGKVRIAFFGFGSASALAGFIFILPRLIGSLFGAPNAAPLPSVLQDLGINAAAVTFLGGLTYAEFENEQRRVQQKEEGALIARAKVVLQDKSECDKGSFKLSDFRAGRGQRSRRPVLCLGDADYCMKCVESTKPVAEALDRGDFLVVPVVASADGLSRSGELEEVAKGLTHVAMPGAGPSKADKKDWQDFVRMQQDQARSQGFDENGGLVVIVQKNGRVGTRFLGYPDWGNMSEEVKDRVGSGLDTRNI